MATPVRKPFLALTVTALLIAGCASPGRYPSLALRDSERATGTLQPAEPEPYAPPATPAETLDRIAKLTSEAEAAHRTFLSVAEKGRAAILAGRAAATGSEAWARAQVALADLEASRSQAMVALADLDLLFVDAELAGAELDRIAAARESVLALVDSENRTIDELRGGA